MSGNKSPTKPISIPTRGRERSVSFSSTSSSDSSNSPPLRTPISAHPPKLQSAPSVSPTSTSPILNYFLASPPRTASGVSGNPGTFATFGRSFAAKQPSTDVVIEEDEDDPTPNGDFEPMLVKHARRLSTGWQTAPRLPHAPPVGDAHNDRGAALLRRLSFGNALVRPQVTNLNNPPPTPATHAPPSPPRAKTPPRAAELSPGRKPRRSATISGDSRPRRAPSPMGERILKGHFDGFN